MSGAEAAYLRAIRAKCLDCCGRSLKEVERCAVRGCPLWAYRDGERHTEEEKTISGQMRIEDYPVEALAGI